MMRVRATADGTYGGFFREGPVDGVPGISGGKGGEVFEIDDTPYIATEPESGKTVMEEVIDARGNPVIDMVQVQAVDERGSPVLGADKKPLMQQVQKPRMRPRMWHWFSSEWMEKISPKDYDKYPITYEENSRPRGVHPSMKLKRRTSSEPVSLSELQQEIGKPIEEVTI